MPSRAQQPPGQQRNLGPVHDPSFRGRKSGGKPLLILGGVILAGVLAWSALPSSKPTSDPTPAAAEKIQVRTDDDRPACLAFAPERARLLVPGPESRIQYFGPGNRAGECAPGTTGLVPASFAARLNYQW